MLKGLRLRPRRLAQISALLKAPPTRYAQVVRGLVGGDMNSASPLDAASHEADDVDLRDVCEDTPPTPTQPSTPFHQDVTYGRARGDTWGYQSG